MKDNDPCPFCDATGAGVLERNELVALRWDGFPVSPGHALIVPLRHVASWFELTGEERAAMLEGIDVAREAIEASHTPDGYNIGINDGPAAGQTVMHVHLHVIPRYDGDIDDPRGGVRWVLPDKARYWRE